MGNQGRKVARNQRGSNGASSQAYALPLLALPMAVLLEILGMLSPEDLISLLPVSKAFAQVVMQHGAGRLTLRANALWRANLAAIRRLLVWAPPSTLTLMLTEDGKPSAGRDLVVLNRLFGCDLPRSVPTSPRSQQGQHIQQFPCIAKLYMKSFSDPGVMPAGLAAICPNMHTLHLDCCTVHDIGSSSSSRRQATSTRACGSSNTSSGLNTLILESCNIPVVRVGQSRQSTVQPAKLLRRTFPHVTCLHLAGYREQVQVLSALGPQLTELHLKTHSPEPGLQPLGKGTHLQQLQKLVLSSTMASAADIELLLGLPSLKHLEVESLHEDFAKDYSSHACKWQSLHLHLTAWSQRGGLYTDALAKLPLHSLTQPLKLGSKQDQSLMICLPSLSQQQSLAPMERLAEQLTRCGVQVVGSHCMWTAADSKELAPAFRLIAPALGCQPQVALENVMINQQAMEALVSVYGAGLCQLDLEQGCDLGADMQEAWHAALSGMPSLVNLTLDRHTVNSELVSDLAAAMARQPAGRCIDVVVQGAPHQDHGGAMARVGYSSGQELVGVKASRTGWRGWDLRLCITSKKME